jgi:uncharacterized NAD-dependent epimerase/dehydratase family protein
MLMDVDVDPQKAIEAGSKAIEAGSDVIDKLRVDTLESYETSQEVADRLGIDASQIRRFCEQERFSGAVKIANRWLIPRGARPDARHFGRTPTWSEGEPRRT